MNILAFTDTHENKKHIESIIKKSEKADILICCGDISIFSINLDKIFKRLDKINKPVLIIHGNHEIENDIKKMCDKYKNLIFIHKKHFDFNEYRFMGYGGGGFAFIYEDLDTLTIKFKSENKKVVFITHAPPYKTKLDYLFGDHRGAISIRNFIEYHQPRLSLSGHFHEGFSKQDKIGKSLLINPGPSGKLIKI